MIREAIILAGGLGTRLQSVVPELPKCLAPVSGIPFLEYLIRSAQLQGIRRFVFALGYKTEQVERFVQSVLPESDCVFSVEKQPLGTGGAILLACQHVQDRDALVLNGDTFFAIDLLQLSEFHREQKAACTLSLKFMRDFDRYGVVELTGQKVISGFLEKKYSKSGLINGGVYALDVKKFVTENLPEAFSFEKDYLEKEYIKRKIYGMRSDAYFIDIGVPDDYQRAQKELIQQFPDGI